MTDRELLEAAAKAAGVPLDLTLRPDGKPLCCSERGLAIDVIPGWWNPLEDDGDAFRLAVRLSIKLDFAPGWVRVYSAGYFFAERSCEDSYAATRRAIVRAAAALVKGMICDDSK